MKNLYKHVWAHFGSCWYYTCCNGRHYPSTGITVYMGVWGLRRLSAWIWESPSHGSFQPWSCPPTCSPWCRRQCGGKSGCHCDSCRNSCSSHVCALVSRICCCGFSPWFGGNLVDVAGNRSIPDLPSETRTPKMVRKDRKLELKNQKQPRWSLPTTWSSHKRQLRKPPCVQQVENLQQVGLSVPEDAEELAFQGHGGGCESASHALRFCPTYGGTSTDTSWRCMPAFWAVTHISSWQSWSLAGTSRRYSFRNHLTITLVNFSSTPGHGRPIQLLKGSKFLAWLRWSKHH